MQTFIMLKAGPSLHRVNVFSDSDKENALAGGSVDVTDLFTVRGRGRNADTVFEVDLSTGEAAAEALAFLTERKRLPSDVATLLGITTSD